MSEKRGRQASLQLGHVEDGPVSPASLSTPRNSVDWSVLHNDSHVSLEWLRDLSCASPSASTESSADSSHLTSSQPLTWNSEAFPANLKPRVPILWAQGDPDLLKAPGVGLCGSRNASDRGLVRARDLAALAASLGLTVVTGLARGVDSEATTAALEAGGQVIGVLPEGISAWHPGRWAAFIANGRMLVLSEFRPRAHWQVGQAMQRNATICALGKAMFVIEAGQTGGTLNAGQTALRMGTPLYAIRYAERSVGNELLISAGAVPIETKAQLRKALEAVADSPTPWPR